jgi:hypothetical protein
VKFTLKYDPLGKNKLSHSGWMKMRTWMRKGYCDSPNGLLGAYWRMVMLGLKAEYLMAQPTDGAFYVEFIERDGVEIVRRGQIEQINSLFLIYSGAKRWDLASRYYPTGGPPFLMEPASDEHIFDTWGRIVSKMVLGNGCSEPITYGETPLLKAVVEQLGHPLGDKAGIERGLAAIEKPVEFLVTVRKNKTDKGPHVVINFQQME